MAFEFKLPDIGEGLTEADIVRWVVPVGGAVEVDQVLVEVETAKAVVEMPSPVAGVVLHHGAAEGETLDVGSILAVIGEPGEVWGVGEPLETEPTAGVAAPIVGNLSSDAEALPARPESAAVSSSPVQALPLVRKLARDRGIELEGLVGTGAMGRITRDDVLAAANGGAAAVPVAAAGERRRMSMLRRTIAEHMETSWREIPHVTTFDEADAGRLLAARKALAARHGQAIPIEALVIKAVVPALLQFREFNATLDGDVLILHGSHDIGIAVDTDDGLLVPVVQSAGERGLLDIASAVEDLGTRGKSRSLTADELSGATFTISQRRGSWRNLRHPHNSPRHHGHPVDWPRRRSTGCDRGSGGHRPDDAAFAVIRSPSHRRWHGSAIHHIGYRKPRRAGPVPPRTDASRAGRTRPEVGYRCWGRGLDREWAFVQRDSSYQLTKPPSLQASKPPSLQARAMFAERLRHCRSVLVDSAR